METRIMYIVPVCSVFLQHFYKKNTIVCHKVFSRQKMKADSQIKSKSRRNEQL